MPKSKLINRTYTKEDVIRAVAAIEDGQKSYREAAGAYNVPLATLCDRIKRRVPLAPSKGGILLLM